MKTLTNIIGVAIVVISTILLMDCFNIVTPKRKNQSSGRLVFEVSYGVEMTTGDGTEHLVILDEKEYEHGYNRVIEILSLSSLYVSVTAFDIYPADGKWDALYFCRLREVIDGLMCGEPKNSSDINILDKAMKTVRTRGHILSKADRREIGFERERMYQQIKNMEWK